MAVRPAALVLAPESPYPMAGGGALRTASLVEYLAKRYDTDVVLFVHEGEPVSPFPPGRVRRLFRVELASHSRATAARAWRNLSRMLRGVPPLVDRFSGFGQRISGLLGDERYDVAVIEHFWCAPYLEEIAPHARRVLLDLHNVESELHASCAAAEGSVAALAHRRFRDAALALEREWLPRFDLVLTASEADAVRASALAPGARTFVYPNALPEIPRQPDSRVREEAIIFTGNLEYDPNLTAARWFHRAVWPQLRRRFAALEWWLAGKNPDRLRRALRGDVRIKVIGPVADAIPVLASAKAAIVPLLAGSGTRFKILEAWAAGTPVVSTPIGAEGLPARHGENLLLAGEAHEFAAAVGRILLEPSTARTIAAAGREIYEASFTWQAGWNLLEELGI